VMHWVRFQEEQSEDSLLHEDPPDYMTEVDSLGDAPIHFAAECETPTDEDPTLSGKLKHFCPSFFSSLSLWERDAIEKSGWLQSSTSLQRLFRMGLWIKCW
jgi:hypothetical protein